MKILVKFCGMTQQQDILQAAELGVDYLGFVLVPGSKRYLTHDALHSLRRVVPDKVKTVLVVANLELPEIQSLITDFQPDVIQLHGNESAELVAKIRGVEVWKAVHLRNEEDVLQAAAYPCERLVVDAGQGGSGQLCDWSLAAKLARIRDIFLAGGITPENVAEALQQTNPAGIDTASGIESEPGKKDPEKMRKFLQFRGQGAGVRVQGAGCRVQGLGCRGQGAGGRDVHSVHNVHSVHSVHIFF
jgi:phosphoribosylanthranilate isomerase